MHIREKTFCCQNYVPVSGSLFTLVLRKAKEMIGTNILQSLVKLFSIVE